MRKAILNRLGLGCAMGCVALGAAALAGCGGDSSSSTGASGASGTSLSEEDFVSQANAICKEGNDKYAALKGPADALEIVAAILEQDVTVAKDVYAKLGALTPPSDLQAQYKQYLSDEKAEVALVRELAFAAKANDASTVKLGFTTLHTVNEQSVSEANALGLTECAAMNVPTQG